jgi:hypothetical protein
MPADVIQNKISDIKFRVDRKVEYSDSIFFSLKQTNLIH